MPDWFATFWEEYALGVFIGDDAVAFFDTSRPTLENIYRSYSPDALKNAAEIMDKA